MAVWHNYGLRIFVIMAAPKKNAFWKLIETPGRKRKIKTVEELEQIFLDYCKWVDESPIEEEDYRGKDAKKITIKHPRPMTKGSFALFAGYSAWEKLNDNAKRSGAFKECLARIAQNIMEQKFAGGLAGVFNPMLIARDLGLVDRADHTTGGEAMEQPVIKKIVIKK